jgi:hypothetical protein
MPIEYKINTYRENEQFLEQKNVMISTIGTIGTSHIETLFRTNKEK